uniref:E3 ubiquitin-protein ligase Midline-1-like n=1 Tax=Styela clava TaxID=7725 RepID=UPI001939DF71|nr:E3 ubiquitin-protein ligase Midline-1-like [Styela clava]
MSASSEDTSDSGFYQLAPEVNTEVTGTEPKTSPRAIRRLSGMTESNDGEDIDFFLKVVSEFRDYVTEKIEGLEEQNVVNENRLHDLQQLLKESEDSWTEYEVTLTKDINHVVALLHRQQGIFMENIKKHRAKGTDFLREKMDVCRRNMKIIAGVLSFARRVKNEKDDTIREQTLKELKQRFTMASERTLPEIEGMDVTKERLGLDKLDEMTRILENMMSDEPNESSKNTPRNIAPVILAQASRNDITKNNVLVRWTGDDDTDDVTYEVFWEFVSDGKVVKRNAYGITETFYIIKDLSPNHDITVQIQKHHPEFSTQLSQSAIFKTLPQPAKFKLDSDTANSKLQISPDQYSVHFPGEDKGVIQKSPTRFTFALNVLGNISFYTGRHYWEVLVNKDGWAVGVAYRNVPRNSWLGSNDSSWILHYNPTKREYKARHAGESADVKLPRKKIGEDIARVGIFIDYEAGIISFIDCHMRDVLYTYHTAGFEEPICAAVNPFYHGGVLTVITGLEIPNIDFNV